MALSSRRSRARRPLARLSPWLTAAVLLATPGCDDKGDPIGPTSLRDRLEANWDLWQAWTAPDYEFDFRWSCFCLEELTAPVRVRVAGHLVEEVTYLEDGAPVNADYLALFPSIAQLFLHVEQALDEGADVILVDFHAEHGYPVSAQIDYDAQAADDELGFTVENLTPTAAPAALRSGPRSADGAEHGRARQ
jgi:hypothetical protein